MATINQLKRDRRRAFSNLRKSVRMVQTATNKLRRQVDSIMNRKEKIPEGSDLQKFANNAAAVNAAIDAAAAQATSYLAIFGE
jgi:hypothetical protein